MNYKCPIFDVSSREGFLTSQQTKYSKVSSLKFSEKLKVSDRNILGAVASPAPLYIRHLVLPSSLVSAVRKRFKKLLDNML